jgi:hypothetical protein
MSNAETDSVAHVMNAALYIGSATRLWVILLRRLMLMVLLRFGYRL